MCFLFADVNECKSRPCDVFAHCTNTVGSFQCSCFPGYIGDGFKCEGKPHKTNKFKKKPSRIVSSTYLPLT